MEIKSGKMVKSLDFFLSKLQQVLNEYNSLWLWRWLLHRLSKRQSLSTTTVLLRTTFTWTIKLNLLLKFFFLLVKSYSIAAHHEKSFVPASFKGFYWSHFDNLESGKRKYCSGKKSGKSLEFRIQKSVRTLTSAHHTDMWHCSARTLFWQLSIDHNIDVHYQVKHRLHMPLTPCL